jgi:serine/threonine protein kinase
MLGTPAFMPPEQAYGRRAEIDARSDLWAVGATLFTALAGRVVHLAETAEETLIRAATEPAPPLASVVEGVPPEIASAIDRSLAADRADRWPSSRAMLDAIEAAHRSAFHEPIASRVALAMTSQPASPGQASVNRTPRWLRSFLAVGAAALFGVAGWRARAAIASPDRIPAAPPSDRAGIKLREPVGVIAEPSASPTIPSGAPSLAKSVRVSPQRSRVDAATVTVPPSASTSPRTQVCGFDLDEEGRKWPKRCP